MADIGDCPPQPEYLEKWLNDIAADGATAAVKRLNRYGVTHAVVVLLTRRGSTDEIVAHSGASGIDGEWRYAYEFALMGIREVLGYDEEALEVTWYDLGDDGDPNDN